jgi:hypothetical protein
MLVISNIEYRILKDRIDRYSESMRSNFPNKNSFTEDEVQEVVRRAGLDRAPNNTERSQVEVYEFYYNPPERYFLYINREQQTATTWTGDKLGTVSFGREWRDNFGGKRVPVTVRAINGKTYHGTYFKSSGDYARIRLKK